MQLALHLRNSTRWAASDVSVEISYADGEHVRHRAEVLDTMATDGYLEFSLRDVTRDWPRDDWEDLGVLVRYSDSRAIARYESSVAGKLRGGHLPNGAIQIDWGEPTWRRLR